MAGHRILVELFYVGNKYLDIDTPKGTFLSPGARTIKWWVETRTSEDEHNGYVRTNYGKFPANPTAFIVAANA